MTAKVPVLTHEEEEIAEEVLESSAEDAIKTSAATISPDDALTSTRIIEDKEQLSKELESVSSELEKVIKHKESTKKLAISAKLTEILNAAESDGPSPIIIPKMSTLCSVCKWSITNTELYNWMSQLALGGLSYGRIWRLLTDYIPKMHPNVKVPTRKTVWVHFEKHVFPKETMEIMAARKARCPTAQDELVESQTLKEVLAGHFDEYKELCSLYTKFREVNDKIYATAGSLMISRGGFNEWSQNKIQTYVSMINTQKSILAEIGKMRQGDKLVSVVAKFIIELFTKSIVNKLSEEFDTLAGIMRRQGVPNDVLDAFAAVTHERLGHLIIEEARSAMDQTKKEFKLPN